MRRITFFIALICFSIVSTTHSATIVARSCSSGDVSSSISASSSGDIVSVPSGNCSWSGMDIPANKDITLQGAGVGNTNITCSGGTCVTIAHSGSSSSSRITGFSFSGGIINLTGVQGGKAVIIDHNTFTSTSLLTWDIASYTDAVHPSVLIAQNTLHNQRFVAHGTIGELTDGPWQHQIWAQKPPVGSWPNIVYIEGNTISSDVTANMPDAARGGRYVYRFNTVSGTPYVEAHGVQGNVRAVQWWEIYNNSFNLSPFFEMFIRGGSGVIFGNTHGRNRNLSLNLERSCSSISTAGRCNGSSNWDGNTSGQFGYPCRDQIGRPYDTTRWSPGQSYSQPLVPAYIFNNLYGGTELSVELHQDPFCSEAETYHTKANRDYYTLNSSFNGTSGIGNGTLANRPSTCTTGVGYWATDQGSWNQSGSGGQGVLYKCTATNTWTLYYTPYVYPHPLLSGSTPPPPVRIPLAPKIIQVN